ncbi:MAG TPA: hypothetical protein VER96_12895 [Polyangiaceae bacterium]|nr:hypothetical protein [Polyangiaceae bacterium]
MFKFCSSFVLVIACVACGSKFSASEGGSLAGSGNAANGGESSATGGTASGDAGDTGSGGSNAGGTAGDMNQGGAGAIAGMGGTVADDPCARIKQDYQLALEKARLCTEGSTNQCSASSTVEPLECGCATLVNANSEYTTAAKKARQAYRDAKCSETTVCPASACVQPTLVSCAPATAKGNTFVCSAVSAVAN